MNNQFDKKIKETVENFELPYDANAWKLLNSKLNRSLRLKKNSVLAAIFSLIVIGTTYIINVNSDNTKSNSTRNYSLTNHLSSNENKSTSPKKTTITKSKNNESFSLNVVNKKGKGNATCFGNITPKPSFNSDFIPDLIGNPVSIITPNELNSFKQFTTLQTAKNEHNLIIPPFVCFGDQINFNYYADNNFVILDPIGLKHVFDSNFIPKLDGKFTVISGDETIGSFTVLPSPKVEIIINDVEINY